MDQDYQNAFEAVLSDRVTPTDMYIKMTPVPKLAEGHYGRLILEDNSKDNYEVIKFTDVDALGVYIGSGGFRNEDDNSTCTHAKGARVRMNVSAQDLEDIRNHAQDIISSSGSPVIVSVSSVDVLTPLLTTDVNVITALSSALTIASPGGSPRDMQPIQIRIYDNGTARAISWNSIYVGVGVTLPTTTTPGQTLYAAMRYNASKAKWHVLAVARG